MSLSPRYLISQPLCSWRSVSRGTRWPTGSICPSKMSPVLGTQLSTQAVASHQMIGKSVDRPICFLINLCLGKGPSYSPRFWSASVVEIPGQQTGKCLCWRQLELKTAETKCCQKQDEQESNITSLFVSCNHVRSL